jgi:hypothetical protein
MRRAEARKSEQIKRRKEGGNDYSDKNVEPMKLSLRPPGFNEAWRRKKARAVLLSKGREVPGKKYPAAFLLLDISERR